MLKFEVSTEEANLLVGALAELPYKVTANLIAKLQGQAQSQRASGEANPAPATAE